MDKYQRVEKPHHEVPLMDNEIRISSRGIPRNYIAYAMTLLRERGLTTVVLKAMGNAISKAVTIAEMIKRRIPNLHQNIEISSAPITYSWEPLEEGLLPLETVKNVSTIKISLSTMQLETSSRSYQPPPPVDQVKPQFVAGRGGSDIVASHNHYQNPQGGGRGRGRSQYGRGNINENGMRGQGRGRFGDGNENGFRRGRGSGQDNNYRGGRGGGFNGGRVRGREMAQRRGGRN